jgi:hypothetical protein
VIVVGSIFPAVAFSISIFSSGDRKNNVRAGPGTPLPDCDRNLNSTRVPEHKASEQSVTIPR